MSPHFMLSTVGRYQDTCIRDVQYPHTFHDIPPLYSRNPHSTEYALQRVVTMDCRVKKSHTERCKEEQVQYTAVHIRQAAIQNYRPTL